MATTGARAYTGGLGGAPSGGPEGRVPGGGQGRSPHEADEIFVFKTLIFNASAGALHHLMCTFGLLVFVLR